VALALDEDEEARDEGRRPVSPVHAYQVVSVLGGEPGRIRYLARRQDFYAFVSLEIINGSALPGMSAEGVEARLAQLRSLRHPAIARLLEAWRESSGDWYLVSDYLAGRVLAPGLQLQPAEGAPAPPLAIFDRVCEAIGAAHAQGVIHGRLGPGSVVLVNGPTQFEPRLTGFTVGALRPTPADDVAGLCDILGALSPDQSFSAQVAALAARRFDTLAGLRAAAALLRT
jgi:hypothetical protein